MENLPRHLLMAAFRLAILQDRAHRRSVRLFCAKNTRRRAHRCNKHDRDCIRLNIRLRQIQRQIHTHHP